MNARRILILTGWAGVALGSYVVGVMGLSALMVDQYSQYTPAFLLWRHHAFPYVKSYVGAGMFFSGHLVEKEFLGKPIEALQRRFGNDFVLEREYKGTWLNPSPKSEHQVELYRLGKGAVHCVIQDKKCIELGYFKP